MARTYKRDSMGRFASGGGSSARPATRQVQRGTNRLTRDNAGRITSVGGSGATARGGRLRTASGKQRGKVVANIKSSGGKLRKPLSGGNRVSRAEPLMTGGTLASRSSLKRARQKLEQNPTATQRGAVTRAKKYAAQSYSRNTTAKEFGRPASVMRKRLPEAPLRWQVGAPKGGDAAPTRAKGSRIRMVRTAGTIAKPKGLKPGALAQRKAARAVRKVDTSAAAIARRRSRARADRNSIAGKNGFNLKLTTRSAITRSAANAIYNRQRYVAKHSGGKLDPAVTRNAIGIMGGLSGTKRQRADQLRESARRRVVGGRRF